VARIAPIRLDPIARAAGNQRGRDDVARNALRAERALELKAAGTRFIATGDWPLTVETRDEVQNGRAIRGSGMKRRRPVAR